MSVVRTLVFVVACVGSLNAAEPIRDKRLLQRAEIDVVDKSLEEVLQQLSEEYKVPIVLNKDNFEDEGIENPKITLKAKGITLQSVLELIADSDPDGVAFDWTIQEKTVTFDTQNAIQENYYEVDYPLASLGALAGNPADLDTALIASSAQLWSEVDGDGGELKDLSPQALRYSQNAAGHREIVEVLTILASAARGGSPKPSLIDSANGRLAKAMNRAVATKESTVPLSEALEIILTKNKIPYFIDRTALEDLGLDVDTLEVSLPKGRTQIGKLLPPILDEHDLGMTIEHEVVKITEKGLLDESNLQLAVYNVRRQLNSGIGTVDDLIDQLQQAEGTGPWMDVDGEGGRISNVGPVLLIRHTPQAHATISKLLGGR